MGSRKRKMGIERFTMKNCPQCNSIAKSQDVTCTGCGYVLRRRAAVLVTAVCVFGLLILVEPQTGLLNQGCEQCLVLWHNFWV